METCDYCNGEIDLHLVTLVSPEGHEWRGSCDRCGHVVSHMAGPPRTIIRRRAA